MTYSPPRMHFSDSSSGRPFAKDPSVVSVSDRYLLYYSKLLRGGIRPDWKIGIAESRNLLDWKIVGEVNFKNGVEANGYCAPCAIMLGEELHLFYQTYGGGPTDAICHAVSSDGLSFERSENPVFSPEGDWTVGRAIDADVVIFKDRVLLYWATRDPDFKIQMQGVSATSLDSTFARGTWKQLSQHGPILAPRVPTDLDDPGLDLAWERDCVEAATTVVRGDRIYMFYAGGYNNQPQQIGVAISDDGVKYRRLLSGRPLIPAGEAGTWNDRESGHPGYFQDKDGNGWLFYQGNNAADAIRFGGDTWYLSAVRINWETGPDGLELPRVIQP